MDEQTFRTGRHPNGDRVTQGDELRDMPASKPGPVEASPPPERFAHVEIMGHRQHWGRIMEVEQFGAKMLCVDVPTEGDFDRGYVSHFYSGSAIFSLRDTDRATVERMTALYRPAALPLLPGRDNAGYDHGHDDPDDGEGGNRD